MQKRGDDANNDVHLPLAEGLIPKLADERPVSRASWRDRGVFLKTRQSIAMQKRGQGITASHCLRRTAINVVDKERERLAKNSAFTRTSFGENVRVLKSILAVAT